ncbi:hypothetical protein K490DRAFT_40468 [Saccharata proteae CBS 121410]|uniref:PBP domain-containing protein n=1 Tax=Saccharata proteae CBS 121410 TaxID=1314787 RepID=A0A9P4LXN3_9PEZI|nr:hypothetical protein K490DRAFT_40468 [Saccharata proteae CBS 121410]
MAQLQSSIQALGAVSSKTTQTYGTGDVILRIGNGGAGYTGLVQALAKDHLSTPTPRTGSITWVRNNSRNTQLALLHGYIDIALTYERDQEAIAVEEGWAVSAGCVFHDHFVLCGPTKDPANITSTASLQEAFRAIASTKSLFHSRSDASATMWKERKTWQQCGLAPWEDAAATSTWYQASPTTPPDAFTQAMNAGAYLLTDRSTLLRQTETAGARDTTVFVEPTHADDFLMNSCFALCSPAEGGENAVETKSFVDYLRSDRAQALIARYGVDEVGVPFFAPVRDGFARAGLRGGRPVDGRWNAASDASL